jgi:hypothetical protein
MLDDTGANLSTHAARITGMTGGATTQNPVQLWQAGMPVRWRALHFITRHNGRDSFADQAQPFGGSYRRRGMGLVFLAVAASHLGCERAWVRLTPHSQSKNEPLFVFHLPRTSACIPFHAAMDSAADCRNLTWTQRGSMGQRMLQGVIPSCIQRARGRIFPAQ